MDSDEAERTGAASEAKACRVVESDETGPHDRSGANGADAGSSAPDSDGSADGSDAKRILLERLLAAHEAWFDVSRDYEFAGRTFAGYAEFHSHGEQYVLVKRAKLWEVDTHEYLFLHVEERLDASALAQLVAFMTEEALRKVQPRPNHMSSFLSLVVIADAVDDEARRAVRTTRFRKNFKLGLQGWADLRLAAVDLSRGDVVANAAGKELVRTLEANLALPGRRAC